MPLMINAMPLLARAARNALAEGTTQKNVKWRFQIEK